MKLTVKPKEFLAQVRAVRQFASDDTARPKLQSVRFRQVSAVVTELLATDGHTLCALETGDASDASCIMPAPGKFLVSQEALDLLEFNLKKAAKEKRSEVEVEVATQTDDGFPQVENVMKLTVPADGKQASFNAAYLARLEALQKACGALGVTLDTPFMAEREPVRWLADGPLGKAVVLIMQVRL